MQIVDVGPRDGLQNEKRILSTKTKVNYIEKLIESGVKRIEAVSFARPDRVPQMADAESVMAQVPRIDGVSYIGLVMNRQGADRAIASQVNEANTVIVASDTFSLKNQGMTTSQSIEAAEGVVRSLKAAEIKVTITIGAAFGCPFEGELSAGRIAGIVESVTALGVDELALADSIGVAVPTDIYRVVTRVRELSDIPLRIHLHNTRNTGYANALAALGLGIDVLDASTGGIGGCPFAPAATGNLATEDLTYIASRSGYETGLAFDRVVSAANFITGELGIPAPGLLGKAGWFPASV